MNEDLKKAPEPRCWEGAACRQSAVAVIEDQIRRFRRQADNLESLLNVLPRKLTREQDEALWSIFVSGKF